MRWTAGHGNPVTEKTDLLVVGVVRDGKKAVTAPWRALDAKLGRRIAAAVKGTLFEAKAETHYALDGAGLSAAKLLLLGLGETKELTLESLRRSLAAASGQARALGAKRVVLALPWTSLKGLETEAVIRSCVEGAEIVLYEPGICKAKTGLDRKPAPLGWKVLADAADLAAVRAGLKAGEAYAAGCLFARDLVNQPANLLYPATLAAAARAMARREGLSCQVHGESWLRQQGMNGVLGVGASSARECKFVVLEFRPRGVRGALPLVALVGKGVTFDTGGISLKPSSNMHEMKGDMGGSAAVLGAALVLARRNVKARLLVVVPTVENMPDGSATRPGDVLTMASGKTVEVLNTDAEGRLILADALHYVGKRKPDWIIDAATLTGACCIALGDEFAGCFTSDARLGDALDRAGGDTFERVWLMPLVREHHKEIESKVADIKNIGGRYAGASTAAAFLAEFVDDDAAWAHLDIAGPAWTEKATPLAPAGPTGYGARLIARAVERLVERDGA
jgi:leucyl aminopeptidase